MPGRCAVLLLLNTLPLFYGREVGTVEKKAVSFDEVDHEKNLGGYFLGGIVKYEMGIYARTEAKDTENKHRPDNQARYWTDNFNGVRCVCFVLGPIKIKVSGNYAEQG
jgi:hypothetical protein